MTVAVQHFLEVDDLTPDALRDVLARAQGPVAGQPLAGHGVALLFAKASARTRNSMELAVAQLGGHPVYIRPEEVGIDERETAEDIARTFACYHAVVAARVFSHTHLQRMAAVSDVPVVNLLSDAAHPMQALADLVTIAERFSLDGPAVPKVAYVGDANNVWRSLAIGCAMLGVPTSIASPPKHGPTEPDLARVAAAGGQPTVTDDPAVAVQGANVVYTDVWTSMGQESERDARRAAFAGYQVNAQLMAQAAPDAVFMHCLPAHRGEEVTDEVIDSEASVVWPQAAHRLTSARGLLAFLADQAPPDRAPLRGQP